jgi:ABC-type transport system involved in multi-copper enzyme maturation permease subunit
MALRVNLVLAFVAVALVSAPTVAVFVGGLEVSQAVVFRFIDDGSLVVIVLGVTAMTSEFRHDTLSRVFLVEPRRHRVLAAKVLAYASLGGALALLMSLAHLASLQIGIALSANELGLSGEALADAYSGHVLGGALWCALGVAVGSLIVNQAAALGLTLVWAGVVERVIGALSDTDRYLPGAALAVLSRSSADAVTFGRPWAAGVLFVYAVIFLGGAFGSLRARDVTG